MYVVVWEFRARPGREREFEAAYGPAGEWARLFGGAPGYLGTELQRDLRDPGRYLTLDRWASPEAYDAFDAARGAEYEALDRRCEALTAGETRLGGFVTVEEGAGAPGSRKRPSP